MTESQVISILIRDYNYTEIEIESILKYFPLEEIENIIKEDIDKKLLIIEQTACG